MVTLLFITLVLVLLTALWFLLPFLMRKIAEYRLAKRCGELKAIVLSYDDGPSSILTPRLLDLLARRGVAATFFVLGNALETNAIVAQRALRDGHEIGSHSFAHYNAWKVWPHRAMTDLLAGVRAVRAVGGDGMLCRPPYGKLSFATYIGCLFQKLRFGWWTIDTKDTRESSERRKVEAILAQIRSKNGGVVLAHDFDKKAEVAAGITHAEYVMELTEKIINFADENEYRIMRLGDVLKGAGS